MNIVESPFSESHCSDFSMSIITLELLELEDVTLSVKNRLFCLSLLLPSAHLFKTKTFLKYYQVVRVERLLNICTFSFIKIPLSNKYMTLPHLYTSNFSIGNRHSLVLQHGTNARQKPQQQKKISFAESQDLNGTLHLSNIRPYKEARNYLIHLERNIGDFITSVAALLSK